MNAMHVTDQLNDYIEGLLPEAERRAVEDHLATCLPCRREEKGLREVMARLRTAPRSIEPERDLWEGISARLVKRESRIVNRNTPSRFPFHVSRAGMAAAAILVIGIATAVLLQRGKPEPFDGPAYLQVEARYVSAANDLTQALEASRGRLAPETVNAVERNLAIIDQAIQDARQALAQDPANRAVLQLYSAAYEQKLDLLRQAARAAAPI
jgi:anti-sigma-K factor RskA